MRFFVSLLVALMAAIISQVISYNLFNWYGILDEIQLSILGNACFVVVLSVLIWRSPRAGPLPTLAGAVGFIMVSLAIVLASPYVMLHARFLGLLMTSLVGAIGRYPAGADVPFPGGAIAWALSAAIPIGVGLLVGNLLRRLDSRERRPRRDK